MDTYRHKGLRKKLVESLKIKGITDEGVLNAINTIPRHLFLDNVFVDFAYQDKAFPISAGQTISHPFTVAFQTQLLELKRGDKVLEIGTGSAYQTCVLLEMKAKVFSIERHRVLYQKAKVMLTKMNYSAKLFFGDGYLGQPAFAPYDKIIITAGAPYIPEDLKQQLKIGGIMVIPVGEGDSQVMKRLIKKSETDFEIEEYGDFKFVPLLQNKSFSK
jgi:protein-L-isoaspartate(D-aspartate) O-methyltransferase